MSAAPRSSFGEVERISSHTPPLLDDRIATLLSGKKIVMTGRHRLHR